jgi:4'-phosphopantetheinyl transferase
VPLRIGPHGRPELAVAGPHFNLSHSDGLVVCVVSAQSPCGVDVQRQPVPDLADSAGHLYLSAAELDELATLPDRLRELRALQLWTLKEAYLKARGTGFSRSARTVGFSAQASGAILVRDEGQPAGGARWYAHLFQLEQHLLAVALVVSGPGPQLSDGEHYLGSGVLRPWTRPLDTVQVRYP